MDNTKKKNTKRSNRPSSLDDICNVDQFYVGDIKNLSDNVDVGKWIDSMPIIILPCKFNGEVRSLLSELSSCLSHQFQIKAIQAKKKSLKLSILASCNAAMQSNLQHIDFQWLDDVVLLLFIYLSPSYSSLRSAFEWVVDLLHELLIASANLKDLQVLIRVSTREVCRIVIDSCKHLLHTSSLKDTVDISIQILPSLSCMALLQKDSYASWIKIENESVEDDMLLFFVNFLVEILCCTVDDILSGVNITQLSTTGTNSNSNAEINISAVEVVRPTECCNDCLRIIVTILKSWKWRSTANRRFHATEWGTIIDRSVTGICNLLSSGLVSKDAGTNLALGAMALQRFTASMREDSTFSLAYYQLLSTLYLLQDRAENGISIAHAFSCHVGLHSVWVNLVPRLPVLLKVAVLRACLSIFDISVLMHVPTCSMLSQSESFPDNDNYTEETAIRSVSAWLCNDEYQKNEEITEMHSAVILCKVNKHGQDPLLFGAMLTSLIGVCSDPALSIKIYGLQTLESWLTRISECFSDSGLALNSQLFSMDGIQYALTNLNTLAEILCMAWSHPARQVNHVVPAVYQRLLAAGSAICSHPVARDHAAIKDSFFAKLKYQALQMPATHRGRYQALALLLPKIGAKEMLHHNATATYTDKPLLLQLIDAVRERDVASSSSSLVVSILKAHFLENLNDANSLQHEQIHSDIRALWGDSFACSICSSDPQIRKNSADYLLPELLKTDTSCGPFIFYCIRKHYDLLVRSSPGKDGNLRVLFLWGMLNVFLQVRVLGFEGGDIDSTNLNNAVRIDEIEEAATCANDDVRLCAVVALTTSLKSSTPLSRTELEILRKCLPFSLKAFQADQRHQIVRAMKSLVMRLSEHNRGCVRDVDSLRTGKRKFIQLSQQSSPPVSTDPSAKIEAFDVDIFRLESHISEAKDSMLWLREELLDKNLYPGSSPDREMTSLDVLRCVFESATVSATKSALSKQQPLLSCFTASASVVQVLLNVLLSSWDRSRRLAADLLLCLSRPLPGFETLESVHMLIRWAFRLASKAKLRESDAGAILLRDIFSVYSFQLSWKICLPDIVAIVAKSTSYSSQHISDLQNSWRESSVQSTHAACAEYIISLNQIIDHRLNSLARLFASMNLQDIFSLPSIKTDDVLPSGASNDAVYEKADVPFSHGLLLSLRYCLQSAFESNMFQEKTTLEGSQLWAATVKCIYQTTLKALDIAMTVVAEASSDAPFAPIFGEEHSSSAKAVGSKGPINASSGYGPGTINNEQDDNLDMAASYINANSVMDGDGIDSISGDDIQRVVVAAWLVVKEASAMLAFLVEMSPPTMEVRLLTDDDIATAGYTLLDNLSRLKHMGAIAETHTALQSISCILLRYGDKNKFLGRLPLAWLNKLLQRLRGDQQVFILRRSAGFAYSFLSLLRAEPVDCERTLLPVAMESLLGTIKLGIHKNCYTVHWKLCVHSMNVLRLLIGDATVGPALNPYITQCVQYSVQGFESERWAVRNSSMMVFTAVVQRSVDVDKNDSGGSSAATATEFFLRFPALYPFLLGELARILNCSVQLDNNSWPVKVEFNKSVSKINSVEVLHPSLYPLLLFLSKMRAPLTSEITCSSTGVKINCFLFVLLLESCCSQRVFQVRVMVSKAIASLVPLDAAVSKAVTILQDMIVSMTGPAFLSQPIETLDFSLTPPKFQFNLIHGSLMTVRELLWNIKRNCNAATDSVFVHSLLVSVQTSIVPALKRTIVFLRNASCAAVHLELLKVLLLIRDMNSDSSFVDVVTDLILHACANALRWNSTENICVAIDSTKEHTPFDVLLWRCALEEMVWAALCWPKLEQSDFSQLQSRPVDFIVRYLDSSISEVREGVLNGVIKSIQSSRNRRYLATCLDPVLWLKLLSRCYSEKEPPALHLTLFLLCRLSELTQANGIPIDVQSSFQDGFSTIATKVCVSPTALSTKLIIDLSSNILDTPAAACALELLGWIVSFLSRATGFESEKMIEQWLRLIECCSDEAQTATLREAVCLSMKKAFVYLLDNAADKRDHSLLGRTDVLLRIWLLLLRLLQDDDEDVRQHANAISFSLNSALHLVPSHYARVVAVNEIYTLEALPEFIAATITRAMKKGDANLEQGRTTEFLNHYEYLLSELKSILGTEDMMLMILNTDFDRLSNKIFEAEQANLFIEPLKSATVLCDALIASIEQNFSVVATIIPVLIAKVAVIGRAVTRVLSRASLLVTRTVGMEEDSSFIGGLTYQKDIFRYCFVYLRLVNGVLSIPELNHAVDSNADVIRSVRNALVVLVNEEIVVKKLLTTASTNEVNRAALDSSMHPWIAGIVHEFLCYDDGRK